MSEKKRRSPEAFFRSVENKLEKTGRGMEASFERLEQRLENSAKSAEQTFENLETKLEDTFERLDKRFEAFDKKLDHILETDGLKKHYKQRPNRGTPAGNTIKAVDGVDLAVARGETLGIVGESGCGKSTVARVMIGLTPPSEGRVRLFGSELTSCTGAELREIRRRTGIVFQDPYGSLDPRMTVADIVGEPLRAYKLFNNKTDRLLKTLELVEACGLGADDLFKFPHQFSGGQRQRICIARALVAGPDIVVCDEAVSALDVSIQAQIINLLCDLKDARGLTYIFISHDLDVVRFIADRVAVMYLGKIVELAPKDALFKSPRHPYTIALLESAPVFGRRASAIPDEVRPEELTEEAASTGCRYRARCRMALPACALSEPSLTMASDGHWVACHRIQTDREE
jgi:oligopeptide/dipeptide ABC transporter ATP-binding protein